MCRFPTAWGSVSLDTGQTYVDVVGVRILTAGTGRADVERGRQTDATEVGWSWRCRHAAVTSHTCARAQACAHVHARLSSLSPQRAWKHGHPDSNEHALHPDLGL